MPTKMNRVRLYDNYSKEDDEVFGLVLNAEQLTADFTANLTVKEVMQLVYELIQNWLLVRTQDGDIALFNADAPHGGFRIADILMNDDGSWTIEQIYQNEQPVMNDDGSWTIEWIDEDEIYEDENVT